LKLYRTAGFYIELINGPMLFEHKASPAEYWAGLNFAIERGWLEYDRSGTFVRFIQAGAGFVSRNFWAGTDAA
jgi:hypothetical protein